MEKKILILLVLCALLLFGCESSPSKKNKENHSESLKTEELSSDFDSTLDASTDDQPGKPWATETSQRIEGVSGETEQLSDVMEPPLNESIEVRSLKELAEMRDMVSCTDEEVLQAYLLSKSVNSKDDLTDFIALVDSIPYLELIEGEITWIYNSRGQSIDTGENYEVLYIATVAENGDWTRVEYFLSVENSEKEFAERLDSGEVTSVLAQPVTNRDGDMTVYAETRKKHPTESGDLLTYHTDLDGIYTRIVYYTATPDAVHVAALFENAVLSSLAAE